MAAAVASMFVKRGAAALTTLGREALRIVLPAWCVACGDELPWRDREASCCGRCWRNLPQITTAKCSSCAQPAPVEGLDEWICLRCASDPLPVVWTEAWGEYRGGLERVLHALKFERHDFLDDALSGLLEDVLRMRGDLAFDAIVPVPAAKKRQRHRGYNQAELLATGVSHRLGIPCDMRLLWRVEERATQSRLPRRLRHENAKGAFTSGPGAQRQSILIIDDICTTGETLRACATALLRAGASRVCAAVVAKAS